MLVQMVLQALRAGAHSKTWCARSSLFVAANELQLNYPAIRQTDCLLFHVSFIQVFCDVFISSVRSLGVA